MYVLEDTGGGGGGTTDYSELTDKPTINGVELDGNKTSSDLGVATSQQGAKADTAYQKPLSGIPESDLSSDVQQALQKHFKGWYDSSSNLPANPVIGDYAYVKGAETTDPAAIYECTTNGSWSDSGRTADTSNVQTFATGEEVNETPIDNTNLVNPATGSLALATDVFDQNHTVLYDTPLTNDDLITGKYIKSSGDLANLSSSKLYIYNVTAGDKFKISVPPTSSGTFYKFAFYSSSTTIDNTTLTGIGKITTNTDTDYYRTAPENSVVLLVCSFNSNPTSVIKGTDYLNKDLLMIHQAKISQNEQDIQQAQTDIASLQMADIYSDKYLYDYNGTTLKVVYNDGSGTEYCYYFKKCMENNLFTFYIVAYRQTTSRVPVMPTNLNDFTIINETNSDNIGPLSIGYNNGSWEQCWIGGNHLYPNNSSSVTYKTAYCEGYDIYADNRLVSSGESGVAKSIVIIVRNTLFNPSVAPEEGATSLSSKMADEVVRYSICRNTIEVGVTHKYVDNITNLRINAYYGMQSMFVSETKTLTSNGLYPNWVVTSGDASSFTFNKEDYPNFNRFIEYSSTKDDYQSTYLYPSNSGNHRYINSDDIIFKRSNSKEYHSLIDTKTNISNLTYSWNGSYTFFHEPVVSDEYVFAYWGTIRGKLALFVNTLDSVNGFEGYIPIPSQFAIKGLKVVEANGITSQDDDTNFYINGGGLYIKAESTGSLILICEE